MRNTSFKLTRHENSCLDDLSGAVGELLVEMRQVAGSGWYS